MNFFLSKLYCLQKKYIFQTGNKNLLLKIWVSYLGIYDKSWDELLQKQLFYGTCKFDKGSSNGTWLTHMVFILCLFCSLFGISSELIKLDIFLLILICQVLNPIFGIYLKIAHVAKTYNHDVIKTCLQYMATEKL